MKPDHNRDANEILREAAMGAQTCYSIEQLGSYHDGLAPAEEITELERHLRECAVCSAELALMRSVIPAEALPEESADVQWISRHIHPQPVDKLPWWKTIFSPNGIRVTSLAMASLLVVATFVATQRPGKEPALPRDVPPGALRSAVVNVIEPVGDRQEPPLQLKWHSVPGAVRYEAVVMEVDQAELWKGTTTATAIFLPGDVRAKVVPRKTLLWRVDAQDAKGNVIAQSGIARFRMSPGE